MATMRADPIPWFLAVRGEFTASPLAWLNRSIVAAFGWGSMSILL